MSARMLKKMQGGSDILAAPPDDDLDNDHLTDNDELDTVRGKSHLNPFDLLNQQSLSESEFKEDDNETEHPSAAIQSNSAAKKKKKKRKKKVKSQGNHISSEDNERQDKYFAKVDPLLGKVYDAVPKQLEKTTSAAAGAAGAVSGQLASKKLLTVELKHLNQQNEMRRTFGKRVVKVENKRGRQKPTLKSTYMVTAKDSWPPLTKNIITMKLLPTPNTPGTSTIPNIQINDDENVQWFSFQHSQYYQGVQHMFLSALERIDSEFLITLIKRCPYHVDSLVQLSEVCKMTEDFALASELIERALLLLESSVHINFSLTSGNSRLDYRRQENRAFFIVLFKHAQYLEERACCRTAFEISKLLLSLQPDVDPLAMILVVDYYALRSKQFGWLVEFYELYNASRNLAQLPNMAYSYALALYTLHGSCERANDALQYALLMFPGVLRPLLDEMSVHTDKRVVASSYFFTDVSGNQSPALNQLVCLYVCRAKVVWRQNDVLTWLESNVNIVLDRIDSKDPLVSDYKEKRSLRYGGTPPRPILRHVILSDYKEKVPLAVFVSKEKQAIMTYDPLPPVDSVNCYQRKSSSSSSPTTNTNNSVSMFFQSLLPSFNLNIAAAQQQQGDAAVEAGGAGAAAAPMVLGIPPPPREANGQGEAEEAGLQQSLTLMMDAMREFLTNFRLAEHLRSPETAAAQSSSSNDDEEEGSSDYVD
ncbi:transcription factor 25 [Drosophila grimshawi]|uniref:GH16169 n=1 Tax=Drosophila grimshawi TaxID=7222 RepID=B4IWR0_DROGR|nr:transcription factor 25 [Drosophila grimshawi]EDV96286.1 GH16169 [Drosophila grimshawi]